MEKTRLSRLTAILIHLQAKRLMTATELAEKYGVSIRTIYRDIRALEEAGVPICTEEGKGYSLSEGYRLPPVMFTEEEANALITAAKFISRNKDSSLVLHYNEAITKIKAILRYHDKDKAELLANRIAFFQNYKQETTSQYLSTVQKAITDFMPLRLIYQAISTQESTERIIEPLALYHTQENWILIAWCRLREAHREFRLDRIQELRVLDTPFEPHRFDLMEYFRQILERGQQQSS